MRSRALWAAAWALALGATACISSSPEPSPASVDAGGLPVQDSGIHADVATIPPADASSDVVGDAPPDVVDAASPCATSNGGCDTNAACSIGGDGGAVCTCQAGYTGNGVTCASACLTSNGGCDPDAVCTNGVAGVVCACLPGFTGNGATCFSNDYAQWPMPPDLPPEPGYMVSSDGTVVTDLVTSLVWQRQVFANPCPLDGAGACTWADAQTYCASLDATGLGGITSGWRLPSLVELLSIVSYGDGSPKLDTSIFPATPIVAFWAQTPNASNAAQAWSVSFDTGLNATQATTTASRVRCVTSVPAPAIAPTCGLFGQACCYANSCGPDLACNASSICEVDGTYAQTVVPSDTPLEASSTVSGDGSIVTDGVTKLVWQREMFANPCPGDGAGVCTWAHAATYCASLDGVMLGGVTTGWRLPSVAELLSITNYAAGAPTLDTALYPSTPPVPFWTETPDASNAAQAWSVNFNTGLNATLATSTASAVRCVSTDAPSASPACGLSGGTCCYANGCGPDLTCNAALACFADGNYAQSTLPTDAPLESEYTVSPGGSTVTDAVTKLVWQRQLVAAPCTDGASSNACTWAHAASYCDSLNALTVGGYGAGWRLPTIVELISIANYAASPTIDPSPFSNPPPASFWSSTANASAAGQAWAMSYLSGINASQATTSALSVRCVNASGATPSPEGCGALGQSCCYANSCAATLQCSGGTCLTNADYSLTAPPPDSPHAAQYTISGDTLTATDSVTGLVWSRAAASATTWQGAATACASLDGSSVGGFSSGWRPPTLVELLSIVDYGVASGPHVDAAAFPNVSATAYWSATPAAASAGSAWLVNLGNGFNSSVATSTTNGVVCVHGG